MTWLKKAGGLFLTQTSEIPYVSLEDGVLLCYDNFYAEKNDTTSTSDDHSIVFKGHLSSLSRKSTYFYKYKKFPVLVPYDLVLVLDDFVANGQVKRAKRRRENDPANIAVLGEQMLSRLSDSCFDNLVDNLQEYTHVFIMNKGSLNERCHVITDLLSIGIPIVHSTLWRSVITMLSHITEYHGYCWTKTVSKLTMDVYSANTNVIVKCNHILDALNIPDHNICIRDAFNI